MKPRRGSTTSPIGVLNTCAASSESATFTCNSDRTDTSRSAPPVRGVAPVTQQQGCVVVPFRFRDGEPDRDHVVPRRVGTRGPAGKIVAHMKPQLVSSDAEGLRWHRGARRRSKSPA